MSFEGKNKVGLILPLEGGGIVGSREGIREDFEKEKKFELDLKE